MLAIIGLGNPLYPNEDAALVKRALLLLSRHTVWKIRVNVRGWSPTRPVLLIAIAGGIGKSSLASWLGWQPGHARPCWDLYIIRGSKPLRWRTEEVGSRFPHSRSRPRRTQPRRKGDADLKCASCTQARHSGSPRCRRPRPAAASPQPVPDLAESCSLRLLRKT